MSLDQYKIMHEQGHFPGHSTAKNSAQIKGLIDKHGAVTLLDFGCGKGDQYAHQKLHETWGVPKPVLYDPAVPGIDKLPNALRPFDAVICCDVLEHLEGRDLSKAVFEAVLRAKKFAFFSISTRPAKKTLPDGRNAHLTIQSPDWWRGFVAANSWATTAEIVLAFEEDDKWTHSPTG